MSANDVAGVTLLVSIVCIVFSICLAIAPLIIWRNTNRTNRLLAALLIRMNVSKKEVMDIWTAEAESKGQFKELFGQDVSKIKPQN